MLIPSDPPTPAAPSANLIDTAPLIDPAQREKDFHRVFAWHGVELKITLANEMYYRDLRVRMNAPPLASYATMADFAAEAPRILYSASLDLATLRVLRLLSTEAQLMAYDAWVEKNIALHEMDAAATLADEMQQCINRARAHSATGETVDGSGN
jgi:hypothetical protein